MRLLIIEPWFGAIGHPAQSLINMASAIGKDESVEYLVSSNGESGVFLDSMEQLKAWGEGRRDRANTAWQETELGGGDFSEVPWHR